MLSAEKLSKPKVFRQCLLMRRAEMAPNRDVRKDLAPSIRFHRPPIRSLLKTGTFQKLLGNELSGKLDRFLAERQISTNRQL